MPDFQTFRHNGTTGSETHLNQAQPSHPYEILYMKMKVVDVSYLGILKRLHRSIKGQVDSRLSTFFQPG